MNTVLVFLPFSRHIFKDMLAGVTRYFGGGMRVQVIETDTGAAVHRKLLGFWNPVGCIVEASEGIGNLSPRFFGDVPVVYLDRTPAGGMRFLDVRQDYAAGAETAARELLAPDITNYAFVGYRKRTVWSRARGDAFAAVVGLHGHSCTRFEREGSSSERTNVLRDWLSALPNPAASLPRTKSLRRKCSGLHTTESGRRSSLIGIDNDETDLRKRRPAFGVCPDFERSGYLCAELLVPVDNPAWRVGRATHLGVIEARPPVVRWRSRVLVALKHRARACEKIG
jgi:DNA-binding LacI/PurR family transcriptional regulator